MKCPDCETYNIDTLDGSTFCNDCGYVFEQSSLVSNQTFEERTTNRGTYVNTQSGAGNSCTFSSREQTIMKVEAKLREIAEQVKMTRTYVDQALRLYKVALDHKFTTGRNREQVVAACLYAICRKNKTSHMLMDFADVTKGSVFKLGQTYSQLCVRLNLNYPLVDPSLFIQRFASLLEFGDKEHAVTETALRFIQRMKRDWIQTGRRPAGICGAALMIAARLHGFNRTPEDVVDIVRIGDSTLRKRIFEFEQTPSVDLTPAQFATIDLKSNTLPPCMVKSEDIEKKAEKKKDKKSSKKKSKKETRESKSKTKERTKGKKRKIDDKKSENKKKKQKLDKTVIEECMGDDLEADEVRKDMNEILQKEENGAIELSLSAAKNLKVQKDAQDAQPKNTEEGEENFSDIDDDEIDCYIRNNQDTKLKALLWHHINKQYLIEKKEKDEEKKIIEESGDHKKRKPRAKKVPAATPEDAVQAALLKKLPKKSSLLNHDVTNQLFSGIRQHTNKTGTEATTETATHDNDKDEDEDEEVAVQEWNNNDSNDEGSDDLAFTEIDVF